MQQAFTMLMLGGTPSEYTNPAHRNDQPPSFSRSSIFLHSSSSKTRASSIIVITYAVILPNINSAYSELGSQCNMLGATHFARQCAFIRLDSTLPDTLPSNRRKRARINALRAPFSSAIASIVIARVHCLNGFLLAGATAPTVCASLPPA